MEINALLMDEKDNVVTCVTEVPAGQDVVYRRRGYPLLPQDHAGRFEKGRGRHQVRREPWCDDRGRCKGPLGLPQQSGQRAA